LCRTFTFAISWICVTEDGVGYISLAGFSAGAGRDFHTALLALRSAAPEDLKGLVLDLRGECTADCLHI
jgi:C-terminal processing protease CtpA/Prc